LAFTHTYSIQIVDGVNLRSVRFLSPDNGRQFPNRALSAIAWSRDGTQIAGGYTNSMVIIWDVQTGQVLSTYRANESQNRFADEVSISLSAVMRLYLGLGENT
jgi:WD40 repeat protein